MIALADRMVCALLRGGARLRFRHYRGHGVHSPFAYGVARQVCMGRKVPADDALLDRLLTEGIGRRQAVFIRQLFYHLGAAECSLDGVAIFRESAQAGGTMRLLTHSAGTALPETDETVVLLSPRSDLIRRRECRRSIECHGGLSMDCRGVIVLFGRTGLHKQHLKF